MSKVELSAYTYHTMPPRNRPGDPHIHHVTVFQAHSAMSEVEPHTPPHPTNPLSTQTQP